MKTKDYFSTLAKFLIRDPPTGNSNYCTIFKNYKKYVQMNRY